ILKFENVDLHLIKRLLLRDGRTLRNKSEKDDDDANDIVYYTELIDDNQTKNDELAVIYHDIGFCYYQLTFYLLSLKYYKKSLGLCSIITTTTEEQQKFNYKLLSTTMSLYHTLNDGKMALDYAFKCLRILEAIEPRGNQEQIELANYCQEAIDLYQQLTLETVNQQQQYANVWSTLAVIYYDLDQISECLDCCQKSMEIFNKTSTTPHGTAGLNYELYVNLHLKNGQRWVAEEFYRKALNIIKTHAPYELRVIIRIENKLVKMFSDSED
ncbi:unnamed protein product, partial [Didymodactylos carnosus]